MTAGLQTQEPSHSDPATWSAGTTEERRVAMANHLAHDARNWLTVLQVYCDLLRSSGTVSGDGRTWMEELSHAVERGQGLVQSLLDSAQMSTRLQSSREENVTRGSKTLDLAVALQSRLPLFRKLAGEAVRLECKTVAHAETTALEEPEFDRILLNVVRNAIDAMPQGGELTIELEAGSASVERSLVLRVSDTGKGIRADILGHIFESGFSTKTAAQEMKSGRGYGLAIVRELVRAAGGTVRVRSTVGQGTCFTMELPTQCTPSMAKAAVSTKAAVSHPERVAAAKTRQRTNGRTRSCNNFGAVRKGTRVPC